MPQPTPETLRKRNIVGINPEVVTNVTSTDFPGHYLGEDHAWDVNKFRNGFDVEFHGNEPNEAVFSLTGLDASVANAFRRILLSEIATLAIEDVFVNQNTSIIQDEVLAHRLGLIPLKGSKEGLRWMKWRNKATEEDPVGDPSTDNNTVVLNLKIDCMWTPDGKALHKKGETDPDLLYQNHSVYASSLNFQPMGQQESEYFTTQAGPIVPVHPQILLAKMRPYQSIDIIMHAVKGIGRDHAKFSPVATASYRLMPVIDILRPILGSDAQKFARCFIKGVVELEPVTREEARRKNSGYEGHEGELKAVVQRPEMDTVSRECLRHEEFKDKVKLGRRKDHFIFTVESTGQWDSDELFLESVKVLRQKCERLKGKLLELRSYG